MIILHVWIQLLKFHPIDDVFVGIRFVSKVSETKRLWFASANGDYFAKKKNPNEINVILNILLMMHFPFAHERIHECFVRSF